MPQENPVGVQPDDFDTPGRAPASNDVKTGEPTAVPSYATGEVNEPLSEGAAMAGITEDTPPLPTEKLDETGEQWQSFIDRNDGVAPSQPGQEVAPVMGEDAQYAGELDAFLGQPPGTPTAPRAEAQEDKAEATSAPVTATAEVAPQPAAKIETTPQSPEEQKAVQEFVAQTEKKSEPERAEVGFRLANVGYHVEHFKNKGWSTIFGKLGNQFDSGTAMNRFLGAMGEQFSRKREQNEKAMQSMEQLKRQGKSSGIFSKVANVGFLTGNFVRNGTLLFGAAGPLGWGMAGAMAGASVAEAGKETALSREAAMEKTRISTKNLTGAELDQAMSLYKQAHPKADFAKEEDRENAADEFAVNKAADEAWSIYSAAMKNGNITDSAVSPEMKMQAAKEVVKSEDLKKAYEENVAGTILSRLESMHERRRGNPVSQFAGKMAEKFIGHVARGAQKRMEAIETDDKLTQEQKQAKKTLVLNRFGRGQMLKDIDRMLSQQGALDGAGAALWTTEKAMKGAVYALSVASIYKLWDTLAGTASSAASEAAAVSTPDALDFGSEQPLAEATPPVPDTLYFGSEAPFAEAAPVSAAVAASELADPTANIGELPITDPELADPTANIGMPPTAEELADPTANIGELPITDPELADPTAGIDMPPDPSLADPTAGIGDTAHADPELADPTADLDPDWGKSDTDVNMTHEDIASQAIEQEGLVGGASIEKIPDYKVVSGDNLTQIITKQIPGAMETDVQNMLKRLSPDEWKALGVGSGSPHLIRPDEMIKLDQIQELIGKKGGSGYGILEAIQQSGTKPMLGTVDPLMGEGAPSPIFGAEFTPTQTPSGVVIPEGIFAAQEQSYNDALQAFADANSPAERADIAAGVGKTVDELIVDAFNKGLIKEDVIIGQQFSPDAYDAARVPLDSKDLPEKNPGSFRI